MKLNNKYNLRKYIKQSNIDDSFKEELLEDFETIHLDNCLEFLKSQGFKTWNLSNKEDLKLDNYLKKYISECIPDYPFVITTEDYCVIYEPNKIYSFSESDLPEKFKPKNIKNIYGIHFSFLDKRPYKKDKNGNNLPYNALSMEHLGRQHWFSYLSNRDDVVKGFSYEECEKVVEIINSGKWKQLDFFRYFEKDKKETFDYILEHIDDFDFDGATIQKIDVADIDNVVEIN
jgi:hypothetical protein